MKAPRHCLILAALGLHLVLAGCVPEVSEESKKLAPFPADTITIGSKTFIEAPSSYGWTPPQLIAGPYSDPYVAGWQSMTTFPSGTAIRATRGGSPGRDDDDANFDEAVIIILMGTAGQLPNAAGTYPIASTLTDGVALIRYISLEDGDSFCFADAGTLNVSSFGAVGSSIVGSYTVDSWLPLPIFCPLPAPLTGTFRVKREIDDHTGNDGSGTDTIAATDYGEGTPPLPVIFSQTYTESAQPLNDPLLIAYFEDLWDGLTEEIVSRFVLRLSTGLNAGTGEYLREYDLGYFNVTGPGFYPKAGSDGLDLRLNGGSSNCSGAVAPLTLTALGPVGGLVTGDFLSEASALTPCPKQFGVTFSVTREPDRPIQAPPLTGDSLTVPGITFAERKGSNPRVGGELNLVEMLEFLTLRASRISPATDTEDAVTIKLYNTAAVLQSPHTQTIASTVPNQDGNSSVEFIHRVGSAPYTPCNATSGTVTFTSYDTITRRVAGSLNITGDDCGGTYVGPGTFSSFIDFVSTFGNDGQGIDTLDLTVDSVHLPGYPVSESNAYLSNPLLYAQYRPNDSSLDIIVRASADRGNARYVYDLHFNVFVGAEAPGTFTEGTSLTAIIGGEYATVCGADVATQLTVSTYPAVGGLMTGSFTFVNNAGAFGACPFGTIDGTFFVTRETDDLN